MVGGGPLFAVDGLLVSQARAKGMQRVQLLKPERPPSRLPDKVFKIDVLADKVSVPAEETTYWCHVMKIPLDLSFKHHIVKVNKIVLNESLNCVLFLQSIKSSTLFLFKIKNTIKLCVFWWHRICLILKLDTLQQSVRCV